MGMGEPLDNYDHVMVSISLMLASYAFNLAPKNITVSTVGVSKLVILILSFFISFFHLRNIVRLARDFPQVYLALSLHAPTQESRKRIIPSSSNHNIEKIMDSVEEYLKLSGNELMIEYIMIKDINDSLELSHSLGRLLQDLNDRVGSGKKMFNEENLFKRVWVNLIPYNPTAAGDRFNYQCSEGFGLNLVKNELVKVVVSL